MVLSFDELRSVVEGGGRLKVRRVYGKPYLYLVYPDGREKCAGRLDGYPEDVRAWIESVRRPRGGSVPQQSMVVRVEGGRVVVECVARPGTVGVKHATASSRFRSIVVSRGLYEELESLAGSEGLTVPDLVERMYRVYNTKRSPLKIPVHKTITVGGEVAYAITVDSETITLTHRELKTLCKAGLIDISLCAKTILGG